MEIKGKLIQLLQPQTGQGKNGTWKKQEIIVEIPGQYPKNVCVAIWGEKINESQLQVGNELNIAFDIESREYNGRWYTDVKAWKIDVVGAQSQSSPSSSSFSNSEPPPPAYEIPESIDSSDDLPF
jgi:hypothetical protein